MQNRYVGDVGDYGKFALLRALLNGWPISLAMVWCLYPDEHHNQDGKHISYLARDAFRKLDPELHDKLITLVNSDRSVSAVRQTQLLPNTTIYFERATRDMSVRVSPAQRLANRENWWRECLNFTRKSDLVFFDPDNGLASASVTKTNPKAGKYVFLDEIRLFAERGQSLILYHHLNRTASVAVQVRALSTVLQSLGAKLTVMPLLFRRGSCRVFCILAQDSFAHAAALRINEMLERGWRGHFEFNLAS